MRRKAIDLARVRASEARLDTHQDKHPEAFVGRTVEEWTKMLQEQERMTATVSKGRRRASAEATVQIAVRLPESMMSALDAFAAERALPGLTLTRSDAVRMILAATLAGAGKPGR